MKLKKYVTFALIGSMFIMPMGHVSANSAAPVTINEISSDSALVDKLAEDLAIIDQANKVDYQGNIRSIDFQMLRNRFGNLEFIDKLEKEFNFNKENITWTSCMWDAIKDTVGVGAVTGLIQGGLKAFLLKKAWKEAAKLIIKVVGTGAVGGVTVWVGLLAYYSVKCIWD